MSTEYTDYRGNPGRPGSRCKARWSQRVPFLVVLAVSPVLGQDASTVGDVLTRVSRGANDVFVSDYLADQFQRWHRRFPIAALQPDSLISTSTHDEVWLPHPNPAPHRRGQIVLRISSPPRARVTAIRRLLLPERRGFRAHELAVLEFAERFAWTYEVGQDGFLQDLLFPDHIRVSYEGQDDKMGVVRLLRQRYRRTLPVHAIAWEQSGARFQLQLTFENALRPLEFTLNIEKHLTAVYFSEQDRTDRSRSLADSIAAWISGPVKAADHHELPIAASSYRQAISAFSYRYLSGYTVSVLNGPDPPIRIEASLPPLDGVRPADLWYEIGMASKSSGRYTVTPSWITRPIAPLLPGDAQSGSVQLDARRLREESLVAVFNKTLWRFSALGLHAALQIRELESRKLQAHLTLNGLQPDSMVIRSEATYGYVLRKLTQEATCYFFPRRMTADRSQVTVTGFAIWQSEAMLWHHMARIEERYHLGAQPNLDKAEVALFPYVRTENLDALFATEAYNPAKRTPIQVIR